MRLIVSTLAMPVVKKGNNHLQREGRFGGLTNLQERPKLKP
jgi:hypothetical protein